jgi:hypothetical protein
MGHQKKLLRCFLPGIQEAELGEAVYGVYLSPGCTHHVFQQGLPQEKDVGAHCGSPKFQNTVRVYYHITLLVWQIILPTSLYATCLTDLKLQESFLLNWWSTHQVLRLQKDSGVYF